MKNPNQINNMIQTKIERVNENQFQNFSITDDFEICQTTCNENKKCRVNGKLKNCLSDIRNNSVPVFSKDQLNKLKNKILTDSLKINKNNKQTKNLDDTYLNSKILEIDLYDENLNVQKDLRNENIDINYMLKNQLNKDKQSYEKNKSKYMSDLDILDQLKIKMEKNKLEIEKYKYKMKYVVPIFFILLILYLVLTYT